MRLISLELESKLRERKLWPQSRIAWAALYVLALELLLVALPSVTRRASPSMSASLGGWVTFLSVLAIVLLAIAGFRWLRSQLLWRARERVVVTDVFFCVFPGFFVVFVFFYWRYSGFSAGDDFSDPALPSCRAVRQLCRHFRHHNSFAQHGSREPSHRPSPGVAYFGEWKAGCGRSRPRKTASSGMVAAGGVRVVSEPATA